MKNIKGLILVMLSSTLLVGCGEKNNNSLSNNNVDLDSQSVESTLSVSSNTSVSSNSSNNSISEISYNELEDTYTGNYYNNISSTATGAELLGSLQTLISSNYHAVGYNGLWNAYESTDKVPGQNYYYDIYSNYHYTKNSPHSSASKEGEGFNREHTTPQSWWGGGTGCDQGNDLFNVYPTDIKVNGYRSNYPYGEVANASYTSSNGCKLGNSNFLVIYIN